MRLVHRVIVSVFAKPEEDLAKIKQGLSLLFPYNLEEEKIQVKEEKVTSFQERTITIWTVTLTKENHINRFLEHLLQKLSQDQKELLLKQAESRLDDQLNFFIRIDKEILLNEKRYFITEFGNCYHIKLAIAAFPAKRDFALGVVNKIFKQNSAGTGYAKNH